MKDDVPMNDGGSDLNRQAESQATRSGMAKVSGSLSAFLKEGRAQMKRPRLNRWWIGGAVVVAVIVYAAWPARGPADVKYRTAEATRGALTVTVTATGTLEPVNTVEVGAEISGQIEIVKADFNDPVVKDQVLAVMDKDNLSARVAQSRASVASSKAKVQDARATEAEAALKLKRIQDLFSRGNASKQDLDAQVAAETRARAGLASAEAQVRVAEATLAADETNLGKTDIKSPINGIVLMRQVEPGQTVAASLQTPVLFKLAEDLKAMQLVVDVDEADIGQVKENQQAEFTVAAFPERKFPAKISQVRFSPKTVEGVVTYQAVLTVDNQDLVLRPGMTATASIVTVTMDDSVLVPAAALRFQPSRTAMMSGNGGGQAGGSPPGLFRLFAPPQGQERQSVRTAARTGGKQNVWVLEDGRPRPLPVTVGPSDGQSVSVSGQGIEAGLKVIVGADQPSSK